MGYLKNALGRLGFTVGLLVFLSVPPFPAAAQADPGPPLAPILKTRIFIQPDEISKAGQISFDAPVAGKALLRVVNGARVGARPDERMKEVEITLNGKTVVAGQNAFRTNMAKMGVLDIRVSLRQGNNQLGVKLPARRSDEPAKRLAVRIDAPADKIVVTPILNPLMVGRDPLRAQASVTGLGMPVPDAEVQFEVHGIGDGIRQSAFTGNAGVATTYFQGFTKGNGVLGVKVANSAIAGEFPLRAVAKLPIVLEKIPRYLRLEAGSKRVMPFVVKVSEGNGPEDRVLLKYVIEPDSNGLAIREKFPIGGYRVDASRTIQVNPTLIAAIPGRYTVGIMATVAGTEDSYVTELPVEVTKPGAPDPLILFNPSISPSGAPSGPTLTTVTFRARVGGTLTPPKALSLDEVDVEGKLIFKDVAELHDDGKKLSWKKTGVQGEQPFRNIAGSREAGANKDETAGDYVYTGILAIPSKVDAEKYYRVRAGYFDNIVTSGIATFGITRFPLVARPSDPKTLVKDPETGSRVFGNEVVIKVLPGVASDPDRIEYIAKTVDGTVAGVIPSARQYLLEIRGDKTIVGVRKAIATLLTFADVAEASPNYEVVEQAVPGESPSGCASDTGNCQWHVEHVGIKQAWEKAGGGSLTLPVAEIDSSGIDGAHPDLVTQCENGMPGSGTNPCSTAYAHGTWVAGVIDAKSDGAGIAGIAWGAKLKAYAPGASSYSVGEAIDNANEYVINFSASAGGLKANLETATCEGRLFVVAAGNVGKDASGCTIQNPFPAAYNNDHNVIASCTSGAHTLADGILAVGATDIGNALAEWDNDGNGTLESCSNRNAWIDIYAPGKNIYTTNISGSPNPYRYVSGTSLATPIASGAAAVLWALDPAWTAQIVHDRLVDRAMVLSVAGGSTSDARVDGKSLIDVFAALGVPSNITLNPAAPSVPENVAAGALVATVAAVDVDDTDPIPGAPAESFSYSLELVDGAGNPLPGCDPFQIDSTTGIITTVGAGCPLDFEAANTYTIKVDVIDSIGLSFEKNFTVNVTNVNEPPTISSIGDQTIRVDTAVGPLPFTLADVDTNVASLTVNASSSNTTLVPNNNLVLGGSGASRTLTITPAAGQTGATTISLRVSDNGGNSTNTSFTGTVTGLTPTITFDHKETHRDFAGNLFDYYHIPVTNWPVYPPAMFTITSAHGPCGLNPTPSRTWVDIFNAANDSRMYGFCAFDSPDDLTLIWFAVPAGTAPPASVYIELHDRADDMRYRSNTLAIPWP